MFGIFYYSHLHVQGPTVLLFKQKRKYIQLRKQISLKRIINHLSYGQTYNGHFFQTHHIFKMQMFIAGIYFQIQKHSRPSNCVYMSRLKGGKKEMKRLNNICCLHRRAIHFLFLHHVFCQQVFLAATGGYRSSIVFIGTFRVERYRF